MVLFTFPRIRFVLVLSANPQEIKKVHPLLLAAAPAFRKTNRSEKIVFFFFFVVLDVFGLCDSSSPAPPKSVQHVGIILNSFLRLLSEGVPFVLHHESIIFHELAPASHVGQPCHALMHQSCASRNCRALRTFPACVSTSNVGFFSIQQLYSSARAARVNFLLFFFFLFSPKQPSKVRTSAFDILIMLFVG